ncbi:hypothetical protein HMPREF1090_02055, partial [[Clostridium] clostridioforme 90A8]
MRLVAFRKRLKIEKRMKGDFAMYENENKNGLGNENMEHRDV